jgi:hypothetical protein
MKWPASSNNIDPDGSGTAIGELPDLESPASDFNHSEPVRLATAATLCSWVVGSALDGAFLSPVLGAAVRPTDVGKPPVDPTVPARSNRTCVYCQKKPKCVAELAKRR